MLHVMYMLYVSSYCSSFEVRSMKNNSNITDHSFIGSNIRYVLGLPSQGTRFGT